MCFIYKKIIYIFTQNNAMFERKLIQFKKEKTRYETTFFIMTKDD